MQISTPAFAAQLVPSGTPTLFEIIPDLDQLREHLDDAYRHDLLAAVDDHGPCTAFVFMVDGTVSAAPGHSEGTVERQIEDLIYDAVASGLPTLAAILMKRATILSNRAAI